MQIVLDGTALMVEDGSAALRDRLRRERRVPQRLSVDGQEVDPQRLMDLGEAQLVELETVELGEAAVQAYASALEFLPKLARALDRAAEGLDDGELPTALNDIARACQGVSWFFELIGSLGPLVGGQHAASWEQEAQAFNELLQRTEQAIAQEDWVLVSDSLRYEWAPRVHAWASRLPQEQSELLLQGTAS